LHRARHAGFKRRLYHSDHRQPPSASDCGSPGVLSVAVPFWRGFHAFHAYEIELVRAGLCGSILPVFGSQAGCLAAGLPPIPSTPRGWNGSGGLHRQTSSGLGKFGLSNRRIAMKWQIKLFALAVLGVALYPAILSAQTPDYVLYNGKILTVDNNF